MPLEVEPGERDLRRGRTDVDADTIEDDVVDGPDRIVVRIPIEMVVIIMVIGITVMVMITVTNTETLLHLVCHGFGGRSASSAS